MKIKVFVIGCGKISGLGNLEKEYTHAGAIKSIEDYELGYCYDKNIVNSKEYAEKFNCKVSYDILDTISHYLPEVLSICTPDITHFDICKLILESDINYPKVLFVEKPICQNSEQFKKLKYLTEKSNIQVIVNHTRRFSSKYSYLKDLIKNNILGNPLRINSTYYGGWVHNATHLIDSIYYLFEDIPVFNNILPTSKLMNKNDYFLEINGKMQKSCAAINIQSIDEKYYQLYELDIWFEKGRVRLNNFDKEFIVEKKSINLINENVLENYPLKYSKEKNSEIFKSYKLISEFINNKNDQILNLISLKQIEPVMNVIWEGVNLFNNHYGD